MRPHIIFRNARATAFLPFEDRNAHGSGSRIPRSPLGNLVFGIWYLVFGIWYLVFGIWYLVGKFGINLGTST